MMVKIFIFGGCPDCEKALELKDELVSRQVECKMYDTSGAEGLAEAAFYHIIKVPSVIIEFENEAIIGWLGHVPTPDDVVKVKVSKGRQ